MRYRRLVVVSCALGAAVTLGGTGCSRERSADGTNAAPSSHVVASMAPPVTTIATPDADANRPATGETPAARRGTPSAEEMWPFVESQLETVPDGPEFEIDAVASSHFGPVPNTVFFVAKALNGTAPFKYTWTFSDGWPSVEGDRALRTYDKVGPYEVTVTGEDANGEQSSMQLSLMMVTPEKYVDVMHLDPKLLDNLKSPTPTSAASAVPSATGAR